MLLKLERKILSKTSKTHEHSISLSEIGNYDGEYVYQAFLSLEEKGYFSMTNSSIDRNNFSYTLTVKGRYYKENLRIEFIKNILIPFVVALVTATVTYHLEKVADEYTANRTANSGYELDNSSN